MFESWPGFDEEIKRWEDAGRHIPTQDEIDEVTRLTGRCAGALGTSSVLKGFALPLGITVQKIAKNFALIYWTGDPMVKDILKATLNELPEFLASEFHAARLLAKWRLDSLTNDDGNIHRKGSN